MSARNTEAMPLDGLAWLRQEHARRSAAVLQAMAEYDAREKGLGTDGKLGEMPSDPVIGYLHDAITTIEKLMAREIVFTKVLRDRGHNLLICTRCAEAERTTLGTAQWG